MVLIDEQLLKEAMRLTGRRNKRALIHDALREYICHMKRQKLLDLFGKIHFDPSYDYKTERRKR